MQKEYEKELTPEVRDKMRKNLIYVLIFSVMMLFGGLTSAYIVSKGDSFWVKFPFPTPFWISTVIIVISSITLQLAISFIKKGNTKMLKVFITATLLLGLAFVFFQFKGYGELVDKGAHAVNNHIIVTDGRYGDYYLVKYKDGFIEVDGNRFYINGREMTKVEFEAYQKFMKQFEVVRIDRDPKVTSYGNDFILYLENQPLGLINGKLSKPDGKNLEYTDFLRLSQLAINVRDGRGDFFLRGVYGKDFKIYFKGKELQYANRDLQLNGRKLDRYLQIKAMDSADTSTSFLYLITFLHLAHIMATMFYMIRLTIGSYSGRFTQTENISLRAGAIFWHFLGILWLYLLTFLIIIH
ncbi:MAG: hypothetical protein V4638_09185 [Bacteroidota bacterium]